MHGRSWIIFIITVIVVLGYGGLQLGRERIGDVRPALLPPTDDIEQAVEAQRAGLDLTFPLTVPDGFTIGVFADGVEGARDLVFSPEGTLLVSTYGAGNVYALPDRDGDGIADDVRVLLTDRRVPHGLGFYDGKLYVAEETQVVRYTWDEDTLTATFEKKLFDLPAGANHVTRTLVFDTAGTMYVTLGSRCNVCVEPHEFLAAVIVSDSEGRSPRLFASGLRNSVFLVLHPQTSTVWAADNGRDRLGDTLPPEEINIIRDGEDYGWPYCYGDQIRDETFAGARDVDCTETVPPIYGMDAHTAPLGLTFIDSAQFPDTWQGDLLVAQHGSWNSSVPVGYKVVRLEVDGDTIRKESDFITGFLPSRFVGRSGLERPGSQALGRPVDLIFDQEGSLYISDDKANVVYKVVAD